MAIAKMAKVIIVSHCSEATELLELLQSEGICQILNAQQAMLSKDWPELTVTAERPKEIEELLNRLAKSISFLKGFAEPSRGLVSILSPRPVIDQQAYNQAVSDRQFPGIIEQSEQTQTAIEKLKAKIDSLAGTLEMLRPWVSLETPVEEIPRLRRADCLTGLISSRQFEQLKGQTDQLGAEIQQIGETNNKYACLVVCLKENINDIQKLLRSAEFEPVSFEPMTGTVAELIEQHTQKSNDAQKQLQTGYQKAASLSKNLLKLQILYDHYNNLLHREQAKVAAPATEYTVLLEGWVRKIDFPRLEKIVSRFAASSLTKIEPAENEEIPIEIENKKVVRPFEAITRLYGMPVHLGIDPTACLAPFFAFFFALCLADVGYGLVMAAVMVWLLIKLQGDKKLLWLFLICASLTIPLGAITGGWFGDAMSRFIPALKPLREKLMLFDPMEQPMTLFILSVILGYIQLMTGLLIAFVHNIRQKNYIAALCDQLTWLVMLNSIVIFGLSKAGMIPAEAGRFSGTLALVPAGTILLFSHRQGSWQGRIGMGAYNLFSAVFYLGDVLSYLRLMALCMVGGGIAMSINIIAEISLGIPYVGIIIMILVFVFGHALNLVLSALGAFVHTLRLQYVEYFTKFFVGGGKLFEPLAKEYKHIYIKKSENAF
jgi:V/A-type H+-transporting ATPase subunit I